MPFNLNLCNSGLNDCAAIYTNTDMFANTNVMFEEFSNVRHYTETNAFQSVSAELRIALMCRILFK